MSDDTQPNGVRETIEWSTFLASVPPNQTREVVDCAVVLAGRAQLGEIRTPELLLYCNSRVCGGDRIFISLDEGSEYIRPEETKDCFLRYVCRNCGSRKKTFSVRIKRGVDLDILQARKFGEFPVFGPPTPSRVISMVGADRDLYLKGRQCENQGLGVGALTYYRRIIEGQKNRLIEGIMNAAQKLGAAAELVTQLQDAKREVQFTKAIEGIKHGFPESLRIGGHNPLTLLHRALSEGVHTLTDAECLSRAQDIRIVLFELADRIGIALTDQAELHATVSRLLGPARPRAEEGRSIFEAVELDLESEEDRRGADDATGQ